MGRERDQIESQVDLYKVDAITLSVMSAAEAENQSVTVIDDSIIYQDNGDPKSNGINDDRLGTMDMDRICKTCMGTQVDCPGHFGHIVLFRPVYHANLLDYIRKVLKAVCYYCSHLLAEDGDENQKDEKKANHLAELKAYAEISNAKARFTRVQKLSSSIKTCFMCTRINNHYKRISLGIEYEIMDSRQERPNNDPKQQMWPEQAHAILDKITPRHLQMLGLDKEKSNPANMILTVLAVGPPPIRPSVQVTGSMQRGDDDLTIIYNKIVKQNNEIKNCYNRGNNETSIKELRKALQFFCAALMSNNNAGTILKHKSGQPLKAIRERLKGKEGRLRGNLMGKRCDFTARSVITCDPNLKLDQLGVPKEIAMNMTIPEVVTDQNIDILRDLVKQGAYAWPGAKFIKRIDGRLIDLSILQNRTDVHLEKGYIVERHLRDDDYVIFNRQPSLHKMSMMGHRIKVLDYQTFRLNLSVTTPYNADFDGDEMNMHVPQSLETKAEIKEIMAVPKQIVAPQSNKPCMGIVQDALLGINRLTSRDTFVEKHVLMNILMFVDYNIEQGLPQPAILKPKPLWSGKQLISLVIPDEINAEYGGDYKDEKNRNDRKDTKVIVQNGQLIEGILGKGTVGNAASSLIHLVWKDLGPQACCDILSNIQLVVNNWLVNTGFTVGVSDIIAKPSILNQVQVEIQRQKRRVRKIIRRTQLGKLKQQPGKSTMESFELVVNNELNIARNKAGAVVLDALAPSNRLKNMVGAGSKGSDLNISQIMSCCGQQNVEGKRIPFGFNRRTLPHFVKDDYGPESRGFVENSYVSGLTPSEFYFHAMGGREGVIDTAVKTADTGYISRRLMKALEDVMVKYDGTVRTSREILVQFLYGEDGMAGEHFEKISLDLVSLSNDDLAKKCDFLLGSETNEGFKKIEKLLGPSAKQILADQTIREGFKAEFEQLRKDRETLRNDILVRDVKEWDKVIMPVNLPRMIMNVKSIKSNYHETYLSQSDLKHYFERMKDLMNELVVVPEARLLKSLQESQLIRESSENATMLFKICLRRYLCSKQIFMQEKMSRQSFDELVKQIKEAFDAAIVNAGEMVGSVAANSIGEPATQMTLNTFHNAGISSKNVTLGVPRLREVINVAKTLKTPSLKIFLDPKISKNEAMVNRVGAKIQYLNLSHIVSDWGIYYDPDPNETVIESDKECIELYQNTREQPLAYEDQRASRWVLRFSISDDPQIQVMFNEDFSFTKDVGAQINKVLNQFSESNQTQIVEVIYSDDIMPKKVIRIRPFSFENQTERESIELLREFAEACLNFTLRGFREITKIFTTKSQKADCNYTIYNQVTGRMEESKENFIIETDGVALQQVLAIEGIDATKTTSNSVTEILQVLGIEATRLSLIYELRVILGSYDIYVNYRHISTLVDIMTLRGILTSITRHGINRTNCGAIRKCTFEETTEILLEAAFFGEKDPLSGISENIIFGQLAPYGTGYCDVVIDSKQLENCIQRVQEELYPVESYFRYTPIDIDEIGNLTPLPNDTPGPFDHLGGTSVYTPLHETGYGDMTPIHGTPKSPIGYNPNLSPSYQSPHHNQGTPRHYNQASPAYPLKPAQSPAYNQTYGYGQTSGQYSPLGNMGGTPHQKYHAGYSPTNMNQTPTHGSNNYYNMTPRHQMTPSNIYAGGPTLGNTFQMPKPMSPSMNSSAQSPVVTIMGGGNSSGHQSASNSNSPSLALAGYIGSTPQYQNAMMTGAQTYGVTITPGAPAYDPNTVGQQDSSDSDN